MSAAKAPWATPIELRIAGIEVVEGGARVRVAATAGRFVKAVIGLSAPEEEG